jgi:rubrerythrin
MEGGVKVSEALSWIEGRSITEVLELAMGLETNSYDLYIKMGRRMTDAASKEVFSRLASGEKDHLERLVGLLEARL